MPKGYRSESLPIPIAHLAQLASTRTWNKTSGTYGRWTASGQPVSTCRYPQLHDAILHLVVSIARGTSRRASTHPSGSSFVLVKRKKKRCSRRAHTTVVSDSQVAPHRVICGHRSSCRCRASSVQQPNSELKPCGTTGALGSLMVSRLEILARCARTPMAPILAPAPELAVAPTRIFAAFPLRGAAPRIESHITALDECGDDSPRAKKIKD